MFYVLPFDGILLVLYLVVIGLLVVGFFVVDFFACGFIVVGFFVVCFFVVGFFAVGFFVVEGSVTVVASFEEFSPKLKQKYFNVNSMGDFTFCLSSN